MPELPDVEVMRRYLLGQGLVGRRFTGAVILWHKAIKGSSLEDFVLGITQRRIEEVDRRAKLLIVRLDDGQCLIFHMRMTGSLLLESSSIARHPMTRNYFLLDDGRELRFVDPRKLGTLRLLEDEGQATKNLGPEPLDPSFTPQVLMDRLKGRKAPIKALLCDQGVIAGIGNIYADEILFASAVHPLAPGGNLKTKQTKRMHQATVSILSKAIDNLADLASRGSPPTESVEGLSTLMVPRKKDEPCRVCAAPIQRVPVRGRSTYFCLNCQR